MDTEKGDKPFVRPFDSFVISLGALAREFKRFDIMGADSETGTIQAKMNGKDITFIYDPKNIRWSYTLGEGVTLKQLHLLEWLHTEGVSIFTKKRTESLHSPLRFIHGEFQGIVLSHTESELPRVIFLLGTDRV